MKKHLLVPLLLLCTAASICAQKTRMGQMPPKAKNGVGYPIAIHIKATHLRQNCQYDWGSEILGGPQTTCPNVVYVDAVLNGKNVELMGQSYRNYSLAPGDFTARLIKNAKNADQTAVGQKFELLFPERYKWLCIVTGISE